MSKSLFVAALIAMSGAALGTMAGCDTLFGTIKSPISGRSVTPEQYAAEVAAENARTQQAAEREISRVQAETQQQAAQLAAEAAKRAADFELAVTRIESGAKVEVMALRAQYEQDNAVGAAAIARLDSWAREQIGRIGEDATNDITARNQRRDADTAKLERERGVIGSVLEVAGTAAAASGVPMLPLVVAGIATVFGITGRKNAALSATNAAQAQSSAVVADLKAAVEKARAEGEAKGWDDAMAHNAQANAKLDATWDQSKSESVMDALLRAGASALAKAAA